MKCYECSEDIKIGDKVLSTGKGHIHINCYRGGETYIGAYECVDPLGADDLQQTGEYIVGYNTTKGAIYDLFKEDQTHLVCVYHKGKFVERSSLTRFRKVDE